MSFFSSSCIIRQFATDGLTLNYVYNSLYKKQATFHTITVNDNSSLTGLVVFILSKFPQPDVAIDVYTSTDSEGIRGKNWHKDSVLNDISTQHITTDNEGIRGKNWHKNSVLNDTSIQHSNPDHEGIRGNIWHKDSVLNDTSIHHITPDHEGIRGKN